MSVPLGKPNVTRHFTSAPKRPTRPPKARNLDAVLVGGDRYIRSGLAVDLLAEASTYTSLSLHERLKRAVRAGDIEVVRVHPKLQLYREDDVLSLRARLADG